MSSETEMRRIILHAANQLDGALGRGNTNFNHGYNLPPETYLAMGFAQGVLRLLATYLKVEDDQPQATSNGQPTPPPSEQPAESTPTATKPGKRRPWSVTYVHAQTGRRQAIGAYSEEMAKRTAETLRSHGHEVEQIRRAEP
jgi:hypothetical protein